MYSAENFPYSYTAPDGKEYAFHTDFREWLRFESLITNGDVPEPARNILALRLIFPNDAPPDTEDAMSFILWFYRCGKEPARHSDDSLILESRRVYDFEQDSDYICAAFAEQYGINLWHTGYMHWWEFRALFIGLHNTRFTDIMGYRAAEITDDMTDSRKAFLLDMQELYELPVSLAEKRRIERAKKLLGGD